MRPSDFLCARGLHPVAPAAPCASCAARNTAPARWATSAPVRAPGAFVVAPRVPAAAPRRLPPLPPLPAQVERPTSAYTVRRATSIPLDAPALDPAPRTRATASPSELDAARVAALALVAHYGTARRATLAAGLSHNTLHMLAVRGRLGAYVCGRLVEAAAKITRAA